MFGPQYDTEHHPPFITGAANASSGSWGDVVRVFPAQVGVTDSGRRSGGGSHINVEETFARYEVLRLLVETHPDWL